MTDINEFPVAGQDNAEIQNTSENQALKQTLRKKSKKRFFLVVVIAIVLVVSIGGISFANKMKHLRDGGPLVFMME